MPLDAVQKIIKAVPIFSVQFSTAKMEPYVQYNYHKLSRSGLSVTPKPSPETYQLNKLAVYGTTQI